MSETSQTTTAAEAAAETTTEATTAAETTTEATTTAAVAEPTAFSWDGKSIDSLPEPVQKIIRDARKEAGDHRAAKNTAATEAATQAKAELAQTIGKALGLVQGDEEVDPAKLTTDLTATRDENRLLKVELAIIRSAGKHGADTDLLIPVLAHKGKLGELDPTADGFNDALDALVKTAVEDNPKLKAAQAAGKGGVEITGGSGEGAITKEKFDQMGYAEKAELYGKNPALYNQLAGNPAG